MVAQGRALQNYRLQSRRQFVSLEYVADTLYEDEALSPEQSALLHEAYEQISTWNVFTNQKTSITYLAQAGYSSPTPDNRYLILGGPGGRSMDIWQTSNGHKVATVVTPGVYARTDSFFYNSNQQMVIGQKGNFDIWDIATGKLLYKYHGSTPFSINGVSGSNVFCHPMEST